MIEPSGNADKLKSCPFCGGVISFSHLFQRFYCNACGAMIGFNYCHVDNLIEKFNQRTELNELPWWLVDKINNEIEQLSEPALDIPGVSIYNQKQVIADCNVLTKALQWVLTLRRDQQ